LIESTLTCRVACSVNSEIIKEALSQGFSRFVVRHALKLNKIPFHVHEMHLEYQKKEIERFSQWKNKPWSAFGNFSEKERRNLKTLA